jgi:hypothetical protein
MTDAQYYAAAYIITLIHPEQFRKGFADWLWDNLAIQRGLDQEALNIAAQGRTHYSAHTIIEYLRHHTLLADKNGEFKINEKYSSSMARMFAHMNPKHADLFEFRVHPHARVGALQL